MAFKALCLTHAPDADPHTHRCVIDTGRYKLITVVVATQAQALQVARNTHEKESIHAVMLCPGFTHRDSAELFEALNEEVSVSVCRGDGPSNRIVQPVIQREYGQRPD
jgi:hypothetical protein